MSVDIPGMGMNMLETPRESGRSWEDTTIAKKRLGPYQVENLRNPFPLGCKNLDSYAAQWGCTQTLGHRVNAK